MDEKAAIRAANRLREQLIRLKLWPLGLPLSRVSPKEKQQWSGVDKAISLLVPRQGDHEKIMGIPSSSLDPEY